MKKLNVVVGLLLIGLTPSIAQKTFTVPAKGVPNDSDVGMGLIVPARKFLPTRLQCLYSTKDLPAAAIMIREIAFQPNVNAPFKDLESAVVTLTLDMSIGPRSPRKWSKTFAQNLGKTITRVFAGKIQLPKVKYRAKQGWFFRIPLKKPFLAARKNGPSLVFDFATTSVVSKMWTRWTLLQAQQDGGKGWFQGIGYNCHFQKISFLWQATPGGMYIGSQWAWQAGPLLAKAPGFLALGDAGWGSKWGGLSLPIDLKPFGAPGCTWGVRPVLLLPFLVSSQGKALVSGLQIPNDRKFINAIFYLQGAYAWPKANALGLMFLPSLKYRIGSFEDHNAATVGTVNNKPPRKRGGGLLGDPVPWCRITY